jgi:small subunit ribosomal protein S20
LTLWITIGIFPALIWSALLNFKDEDVTMAHHRSAKKRIRQTETKTEVNRARRGRIRTFVKRVEAAVASGDATKARAELQLLQPEIMRGVSKGVVHLNTASRKLSRLSGRIKALAS